MIFRVHTERSLLHGTWTSRNSPRMPSVLPGPRLRPSVRSCHARNSRGIQSTADPEISVTMRHLHEALDSMQARKWPNALRGLPAESRHHSGKSNEFTDERGATKSTVACRR